MDQKLGAARLRTLGGASFPCAWSRCGKIIVAADKKGSLGAWDVYSGRRIWTVTLTGAPFNISVNDHRVAVLFDRNIQVHFLDDGQLIKETQLPDDYSPDGRWHQANLSWSSDGKYLSACEDGRIFILDSETWECNRVLTYPKDTHDPVIVRTLWQPQSGGIIAASYHAEVWNKDWEYSGRYDFGTGLYDVALSPEPNPRFLAGGAAARSVVIWDAESRATLNVLEGHTGDVHRVVFTYDGKFLISASEREVRIWLTDGWKPLGKFGSGPAEQLIVSPTDLLVAVGSVRNSVQIWKLDEEILLEQADQSTAVTYTSAKIVLVGDSGVGKTGLGWRLAHGSFKEHSSTHGQQFWLLNDLTTRRSDGAICEAILWDLAGQPDYRLIHALFLDDTDLALLVCDPTHAEGPVQGVRFWIKQLNLSASDKSIVSSLVAARCDRGTAHTTIEELSDFARQAGLQEVFYTSAATGEGINQLVSWLKSAINWSNKPATVTTSSFKKIKDYVLGLKENSVGNSKSIYSYSEVHKMISGFDHSIVHDNDELSTALLHLSNHGYVGLLRGSSGERRVLLIPELLNNLAASVILEARRNPRGLGSLDETRLMEGGYQLAELDGLGGSDRDAMLDSVVTMLIQHNVCFREVDPLNKSSYIVFPELINSRKPLNPDGDLVEEDVSYTISGSVENFYTSLVVLLGYTNTFTRTAQWRGHARYEVGEGLVCGFRLAEDRGGEQDFVLYYGQGVGHQVRNIFKGLFESFLSRHDVIIHRFDPVACSNGHRLNRVILRDFTNQRMQTAHCPVCANIISIPDSLTPTRLSEPEATDTKRQERVAKVRGKFEEALFKIKSLGSDSSTSSPSVFISYAWGDAEHERWVERRLARDLLSAGIDVILDRWENSAIGASVPRFVERVSACDKVIVVGTRKYREKYLNLGPKGTVVAAEGDLISARMLGTEDKKRSVLPILVDGDGDSSFPDILQGRVYGHFTNQDSYELSFLNLISSVYGISSKHQLLLELRDSLSQTF